MKPESFSRALKRLKQMGVDIQRDHVYVPDIEALREYVQTGRFCCQRTCEPGVA